MSENQSSAHPALTLDVRLRGSKCATRELAFKLHLGSPICALRDISQLIASHESTRPWGRHWCFAIGCCLEDHTILCKPNYLVELLSRQSFRGRCWGVLLEDSNLVDPASSHTLVSKIKPCMSKYKHYTVKLRMAHYISYSLFDSPYYLDNRSNSRANTCVKPRLTERCIY